MSEPYIQFFDASDVLITPQNPIEFGLVEQGSYSDVFQVRIWNDMSGTHGSIALENPRLSAIPSPGSATEIFAGTELNLYRPMLQARSCAAYGTIPDMNLTWTPIGPSDLLILGDIPAGCGRQVEVRLMVPQDAPIVAIKTFTLRIS